MSASDTTLRDRIANVLYPPDWEPPTDKRGDDDPDGRESQKRWVNAGAIQLANEVLDAIDREGKVIIDLDRAERIHLFLSELSRLGYERGVGNEVKQLCELYLTGEDCRSRSWGLT